MEKYENIYKKPKHFSFGQNWQNFLKNLNSNHIKQAKLSLADFLKPYQIKNKTFIDIGCGSGLSSLAAFLLNAKKVISLDIDIASINCTKQIKTKQGNPKNWAIKQGSILNRKFLKTLPKFGIVYSWGVLHHTGDMYTAIDNATSLVEPNGLLFIAIYNDFQTRFHGGTSKFWLKVKKKYNQSSPLVKKIFFLFFAAYNILGITFISSQNPIFYIKNYHHKRGMSWHHDIIDWLGGYPYEFATPDKIINHLGSKNFLCQKMKFNNGIGCNQFLFKNLNKK